MRVEEFILGPSEGMPNNPKLPVLLYRAALAGPDATAEFETQFSRNGWQGIWRNGVFGYHHYHTGAHEVLGIGKGSATLLIGGPTGRKLKVSAGDCIVLPAGTGHKNLGADADFEVVGAYPPGQHADIQTLPASPQQRAAIANLALPRCDPIAGAAGPLIPAWRA